PHLSENHVTYLRESHI
ncbi:hypothetical protein CP10743SC13_1990B, partial [Chlamydia psittaci 10_743_SC13]